MINNNFARTINTNAFDERWKENSRLKDRFRYNFEAARKNLIYSLKKTGVSKKNKKILDIGFGSGLMMFNFDKSCEIYGTEFSDYAIKTCNKIGKKIGYKKIELIVPDDSEILPYEDNFFDIIIASHVVEHVEKDKLLLKEMHRCLKKSGVMYVICPIDNLESNTILSEDELINPLYLQKKHWHVRNYNEASFCDRFKDLSSPISFKRYDMKIWDWKVRLDSFRSKLSSYTLGKPFNFLIKIFLNVPLCLIPLKILDLIDSFFGLLGYKNRQSIIAVKKL